MSDELKACPFCGSKPTVDSNGVVWCPCFHESVETWNKRSNRAKTLSEISGEIVIDAEMKAVGQAFVKEFYQMQYQVHDLQVEVEATKAMVERLIEAGTALDRWVIHFMVRDHATTATQISWHALVAEWQANQKGDSNV